MNCIFCGKTIVLVPSAAERAKKSGGKPSDYTKLFQSHSQCQIDDRNEKTSQLIKEMKHVSAKQVYHSR